VIIGMEKEQKDELITYYIGNNASNLYKLIYPMLITKGVSNMEFDDYIGKATDLMCELLDTFDDATGIPFHNYFKSCLDRRVKTWVCRDSNRLKRRNHVKEIDDDGNESVVFVNDISLDTPLGDDDSGATIGNMIEDKRNNRTDELSECAGKYLDSLSIIQKQIAELIMKKFSPQEIREELNITEKQYYDAWNDMKSYEKKRVLFQDNDFMEDIDMNGTIGNSTNDVAESYKNTSYSVDSISKQLQKKRIRDDHILQRHSGMWAGFAKSELVADILRGKSLTQVIISEEIKNGLRMQWLIDGKQRCTTLDDFLHDGFAISKNIKNFNIKYQTVKTDEDGNEILNEDGFTEMIFKEFDIRGKKFSKLPEELQDIFKDRQIPVLYNMNCSKKDIAEDIARFNRSKPMNQSQSGWLGLEEGFAELVDNILKMPFFQIDFEGSSYIANDIKTGKMRRVIIESIMASDFLCDFNTFDKMCEYLTEEASDSNFTDFYALVERLTPICTNNVMDKFSSKDSFLWFGLFSRFINLGAEDRKFVEFLNVFEEIYDRKEINGVTYHSLCFDEAGKVRATKDKYIVIQKINLLEKLMMEYLHINIEETQSEEINTLDFIRENVSEETTEEDITFYQDMLDDLTLNVDNNSKLLNEENLPSLLAIIAYSCRNDIDLDDWFIEYFNTNNTYIKDQKANFLHIKQDLSKFLGIEVKIAS
jgi:hypothetical protein